MEGIDSGADASDDDEQQDGPIESTPLARQEHVDGLRTPLRFRSSDARRVLRI